MDIINAYRLLDNAPLKRFHYKIVLLSSFAYGLTGMNVMLIASLVTSIAREWNLNVTDIGYLLSFGYLGMFIGALIFGKLADVIGRKKILMSVLSLEAVFTALCGLSPNLYALYVLRFIAGLGLGGALPIPGVYVSEHIPVKYRGLFLGLVESCWVYGALLSLGIPYFLLPILGWRGTFATALLPLMLVPLIAIFLPESIRYLIGKGKFKEAQEVLVNVIEGDNKLELKTAPFEASVLKRSVKELLSARYVSRTFLLFVLWGALVYTYHGIFLWLPTFYANQFNLKDLTSIWWTLVVTLFQIPGYYSASLLLDKIGRKKVLAIFLFVAGISSAALSLTVSLEWVLLWSAIISFFNLGAWAGLYAYTPELYPTEIRGAGAGAAASFGRLIGILAPSVTAFLFSTTNLLGPFVAFSFAHLFASLLINVFGIETMKKSLEIIS